MYQNLQFHIYPTSITSSNEVNRGGVGVVIRLVREVIHFGAIHDVLESNIGALVVRIVTERPSQPINPICTGYLMRSLPIDVLSSAFRHLPDCAPQSQRASSSVPSSVGDRPAGSPSHDLGSSFSWPLSLSPLSRPSAGFLFPSFLVLWPEQLRGRSLHEQSCSGCASS